MEIESLMNEANVLHKNKLVKINIIQLDDIYLSECEPILITTKKLSDLGFRKLRNSKDWSFRNIFLHLRKRGWVINKGTVEMKYIHELQMYVYSKKRIKINLLP